MIEPAISYGFGNENKYNLSRIPESIQLALYKYDLYIKRKDEIWKSILEAETKVPVIHLPIDSLRRDFNDTFQIIKDGFDLVGCTHFVIHPNKKIKEFIEAFLQSKLNVKLCIENFQWKKKKVYRSPLEIIERCIEEGEYNLSTTFDTSHAESIWFDHRIMPYLLKHISIIHLSNRAKDIGQHMPFNSPKGELNLVKFIRDLKHTYNWSGKIVLEYMEEYKDKTLKNYEYLKRLVT